MYCCLRRRRLHVLTVRSHPRHAVFVSEIFTLALSIVYG